MGLDGFRAEPQERAQDSGLRWEVGVRDFAPERRRATALCTGWAFGTATRAMIMDVSMCNHGMAWRAWREGHSAFLHGMPSLGPRMGKLQEGNTGWVRPGEMALQLSTS